MKCSNSNVKTKSILTKSSVNYGGQEKILPVPNNGNSVWDAGPQHTTKELRAKTQHVPQQRNENALEDQTRHYKNWASGSTETAGSVQQQSSARSQRYSGARGCQDKAPNEKCSRSNIEHNRTLMNLSVKPQGSETCSQRVNEPKLRKDGVVDERHSNTNVKRRDEMAVSSLAQQPRSVRSRRTDESKGLPHKASGQKHSSLNVEPN
jgi:hypothetical protein